MLYDFREFMDRFGLYIFLVALGLSASLWLFSDNMEDIEDRSTPENTPASFERIGPRFHVDGLYRIEYEGKSYLLYQADDKLAIIEHTHE